ncbi:MAG: TonB-dependent receptor [Crocinitomicaceae bacterium]|nr:TonB-dependent receptor [Crocinitomicaceae bacterium]
MQLFVGFSQVDSTIHIDSSKMKNLDEIVIFSKKTVADKMAKPLSGIEGFLSKIDAVNLIQRGGYASEPLINGMSTERSVITIDGMRIYGACTDKMDPVTSYVEITNLEKATVHGGANNSSTGASIAGSMDLVRKKAGFGENNFNGMVFLGIESNNLQKIAGTSLSYSLPKFYTDVDFTFRDAANYKAGGRKEVLYSQYTKFNTAANLGVKLGEHNQLEGTFIYDHALNVGYPALPMDVSTAKALIGSIEYSQHHITEKLHLWRTKIYYNDVTHIMDDSKRPIVPIRMDMPGWTKTIGFYSLLEGFDETNSIDWQFNLSGHHNQSIAEMTMYPNDPNENEMFMLTWPGVNTTYVDAYGKATFTLTENWKADLNAGLGIHHNQLYDDFGYKSLAIFYPLLEPQKTRILPRGAVNFKYSKYKKNYWEYIAGIGYSERAPSVSEGYGFYLFNSFDKYDYVGNPLMKNEQSISFNTSASFITSKVTLKLAANYFFLMNYIIGKPDSNLSAMTIGANGVKLYNQLKNAHLLNGSLTIEYQFVKHWNWNNRISYRRGIGDRNLNLPMIQPFSYTSSVACNYGGFAGQLEVVGATKQVDYSSDFGETPVSAYAIINFSAAYKISVKRHQLTFKAGIENILDTYYSTFADWNRIPRMGRNFFANIVWGF